MEFKVGDKVVGNASGYFHRVGMFGTVEGVGRNGTWVTWSDGETHKSIKGCIDLVSSATPETTPPRKMHPDDFVNAINDFAADNGFSVEHMTFKTQRRFIVYYTNPQPAN